MSKRVPLVALVGRPNVGKSTLFNRLLGYRASLVHNEPGVTRDRIFGEFVYEDRRLRLVDTGGFELGNNDEINSGIRMQMQLAVEEADFVVLITDGQSGPTPGDIDVADLLRRSNKKALLAVNKLDVQAHDALSAEMYELGIDPLINISAEHGRGMEELLDTLVEALDPPLVDELDSREGPIPVVEEERPEDGSDIQWDAGTPINVAVIGRPNVGKSSLVNYLLGEERMLATEVAGTTRDSVDSELEVDGQSYVLIDTAGLRRKRSIANQVEQFAAFAAVRGIDRADIVMLVVAANETIADQDAKIASLAHERGKGVVIVANKWDLMPPGEDAIKEFQFQVEQSLPFLSYANTVRLSALTGRHVGKLLAPIVAAQRERHRRVSTGDLNRFFERLVERHPPPFRQGRRSRLYYASQPLLRPPTFIFAVSRADQIPESYRRYLSNQLRERYGFRGTPLWLKFRQRGGDNIKNRKKR